MPSLNLRLLTFTLLVVFAVRCPAIGAPNSTQPPVALIQAKLRGVAVTYIAARLNDPRVEVRIQVAQGFPRADESFTSMVRRGQVLAAINGTYFSKDTKIPIGDIVIDGRLVNRGWRGTALALDGHGGALVLRNNPQRPSDWAGYPTVISCGPALVLNGQVDVDPAGEGFHDPHIMGSVPRMAVGYTGDGHLLLVKMAGGLSFVKEAQVMLALGCVGALNLDAGASAAMYYRGRIVTRPGRNLTNIITISAKHPDTAASPPGASGTIVRHSDRGLIARPELATGVIGTGA